MNWRSHAFIGAVSALLVLYFLGTRGIIELGVMGFIGAMAALVPDLDHDMSKGRKILDITFISVAFFIVYFSNCGGSICVPSMPALGDMAVAFFAFAGIYFIFFMFFKPEHRGITHTLVAGFVFSVLVYVIAGWTFAIAGLVGYVSHLFADRQIRFI